ncbi:MAG: adenylyl-sulfate reductase [Candidatus Pelagibacter sp.]|nr:adenylyl-sulfate reductase [Candidatus Pelagibacter sp.]
MFAINPFSRLSEFVPSSVMQAYIIVMIILVVVGILLDIIHKKNVRYFFDNAKKAKKSATNQVSVGKKTSIVIKTVASDILTTSELAGRRRIAHLLGMYGTITFWVTSVIMIFCYSANESVTPSILPLLWHLGAITICLGGYWFWFFLRVDVSAEGNPWYRIIKADLFVLSLVVTATFGLIWSYLQAANISGWDTLFLVMFMLSNLVLFGGVYWSKFAHMFYKPGAAIQKNLSEADGSRDNLPLPSNKPKEFGLGIKREAPRHY